MCDEQLIVEAKLPVVDIGYVNLLQEVTIRLQGNEGFAYAPINGNISFISPDTKLDDEGKHVVYSDTDSIFVQAPVSNEAPTSRPKSDQLSIDSWKDAKDTTLDFGKKLATRFSKEGAELEFETALSAFFSHGAKKRYVGRVVWPREELLIRGYEVRRTDSFELLRETMTEMFELILDNQSWSSVEMTKTVSILTEFSHLVRKALSKKLDIKFLPRLAFVEDNSFDYAEKIERLINKNKNNETKKNRDN